MGLFWFLALASLITLSAATTEKQTYIVRVRNDAKPSIFPDTERWYSSTLKSIKPSPSNTEKTEDFLHIYTNVFHGFSAKLTSSEASQIKKRPGVLDVIPDRIRQIHTTRSPQFLGLNANRYHGLLIESDYGSDIIIGILDSGIWPERRSFHDHRLGPIPPHWKGECIEGTAFSQTNCNKKLIGARFFAAGYEATRGPINNTSEFRSARDSAGHGTHTASTAAGRYVNGASLLGYASGVAAGIAPKARIAVYKICWSLGCFDSDIVAGIDKAVGDGVDVISISVGSGAVPYHLDAIAMASFGAMERGVFVSASAGNNGPGEMTVTNVAPWITTVGAGTLDRNFPADVRLGDGKVIRGVSLYSGGSWPPKRFFPLVYAGNVSGSRSGISALCMRGSFEPEAVRGKIVLCERGGIPRVAKGEVVKEAGGAGMILANASPDGEGLIADPHVLPVVAIGEKSGYDVNGYIATSKDPKATFVFHGTRLGIRPAPVVASFSSRGPNLQSAYVIKPDIIAPGVNILAAWSDEASPTRLASDTRRTEFNIMSGTSMACPHVSGLAALLLGAHPGWSPARIRSALMTTAYVRDNLGEGMLLDESSGNASTVWDVGSGHVDPEKADDPGLVYDLTVEDYLCFLCDSKYTRKDIRSISHMQVNCTRKGGKKPWNLNYPSISVVFEESTVGIKEMEVRRSVTNVGHGASVYEVKVRNPVGAEVRVEPQRLEFGRKGQKQTYVVRISAASVNLLPGNSRSEFGMLTWTDGRHVVRSPITVMWQKLY